VKTNLKDVKILVDRKYVKILVGGKYVKILVGGEWLHCDSFEVKRLINRTNDCVVKTNLKDVKILVDRKYVKILVGGKYVKILVDGEWLHWIPRDSSEVKRLIKWTNDRMEEERSITEGFIQAGDCWPPLPPSIESRRRARCKITSGRGGRPPTEKHGDPMWEAVWDEKEIKQIWLKHFGHKNRPANDMIRAERIAAERWKVNPAKLVDWVRKAKKT
jgi:hypothetical protein